jgi:GNAT superfamily N-acetyltransferase
VASEDTGIFAELERFYDTVPRVAAVAEEIGDFVLFRREGPGYPYYARPRLGATALSAADITEVRARQRALGLPEAFEWVHETTPALLAVARSAGLDVLLAPLMVLSAPAPVGDARFLHPDTPGFGTDLAAAQAVARLAFADPATSTGTPPSTALAGALTITPAGPAERDAVPAPDPAVIADQATLIAEGHVLTAVSETPAEGIVATGSVQRAAGVAELVGIATLPSARRHGHGTRITAALSHRALATGDTHVFLSAGDDDVARMYAHQGFRRVGTACIASPAATPL